MDCLISFVIAGVGSVGSSLYIFLSLRWLSPFSM